MIRASLVLILVASTPVLAWNPAEVGELGSLIPFHKDAIGAGLMWGQHGEPKICFWMRPAEYRGTDLVDPAPDPVGALSPTFNQLVYGGFPFSELLDGSVKSRIKADIPRENTQCVDLTSPSALWESGKFDVRDLTAEDFQQNADAFHDAGFSHGLAYNVFCSGNVTLADGRIATIGGHDKIGNDGIGKINIFDPATENWVPRVPPPVRTAFAIDPAGTLFTHPSALVPDNVDPPDPSDMKYGRWYPSAITLPDGRVLILSGTDLDSTPGPAGQPFPKIRRETPEVYDPATDRNLPIENARKLLMMYPRSHVVQTGRGPDDWQVAVLGSAEPPFPEGDQLKAFDPWHYGGKTWLFDVRGALADPDRETPGEGAHWTYVTDAAESHNNGATAALWTLDMSGMPIHQRIAAFGGGGETTETSDNAVGAGAADSPDAPPSVAEMIDWSDPAPHWTQFGALVHPASQNNAVAMPDGKVLIIGGRSRTPTESIITYTYQLFDPDTGTLSSLVDTTVPRHDHSTAALLPDGTVISMGGNREELVPGDINAGVPVAQIYRPAYLFRGERPSLDSAPSSIGYGGTFSLKVTSAEDIGAVVIIRTGPVTHNWDWGNRYVRLAFEVGSDDPTLTVAAPAVPGAAVPGPYLLFVVNASGVPSVGRLLYLH